MIKNKKIYTTFDAAKIFNVDISTIIHWADSGKMPVYRTPGGHRRVRLQDLVTFAKNYGLPLPAKMAESSRPQSLSPDVPPKILIVEDDPGVAKFVSAVAKNMFKAARVETAMDGFAAGERLAEFKPDILVLDIKLPGIDGFEVLRRLKNKDIRILAITAFPSRETKERIFRAGAKDFLAKPFTVEELKKKLTAVYSGRRRH